MEFCSKFGIPVEGEVGRVLIASEDNPCVNPDDLTGPSAAAEFVRRTGVKSVAVAVGL